MSKYLTFDGGEPAFAASNRGWGEFGDWADELDVDRYDQVVHLWDHGWSQDVPGLARQLEAAARESPPGSADVAKTVAELAEVAGEYKDAEAVCVTDGVDGDESPSPPAP